MDSGVLHEAYERFHRTGPEWGENQLTNHGPMAVEVLVRRGRSDEVDSWVDRYIRRLDDMPVASDPVTDDNWRDALGRDQRIGDWTDYFVRRLDEQPWREVLVTWWPRLLPGIVAGTTHGVIRVGHVVRALLGGSHSEATIVELAHGLAFWAARARGVPITAQPGGTLDAATALDRIPRIASQAGSVSDRLGRLSDLAGWSRAVAAWRPATTPEQVPDRLADLVTAATLRYLKYGDASPVLLVHTATAPNAVRHTLPALPKELWAPSLSAVWNATAAIFAAYAPIDAEQPAAFASAPAGTDPVAAILDRAIEHGDEHVIKFVDTAIEVYARTGQAEPLAAAVHITTLIAPN